MPVSGARETVSVFEHWGQKRSISFCWCYLLGWGVELEGSRNTGTGREGSSVHVADRREEW